MNFFISLIHWNNCRFVIQTLYKVHPVVVTYSIAFILFIVILSILWGSILLLRDWYKDYLDTIANPNYLKIYNPFSKDFVFIPLSYKIYSLPITIFKCLFYLSFSIILIIILRSSNLGKYLDIYSLWFKFYEISFLFKLFIVIIAILYCITIFLFFKNIYSRLFLELKMLYIYLIQFGGQLDPKSNYYFFLKLKSRERDFVLNSSNYFETLILRCIKKFSIERLFYLYLVIETKEEIEKHEIDRMPSFLYPLVYLSRFSKYKDHRLVNYLRYISKELLLGRWTFFKIFPIFIILLYFLLEIMFNSGIIKHFYLILFIYFLYNVYYNTVYFLAHVDSAMCFLL